MVVGQSVLILGSPGNQAGIITALYGTPVPEPAPLPTGKSGTTISSTDVRRWQPLEGQDQATERADTNAGTTDGGDRNG